MKIGCVIMASGMARRFGSNKLLCDFRGEPMVLRILRSVRDSHFDACILVTRHKEVAQLSREQQIPAILHELPLRSDTVRLGLGGLLEQCKDLDGVVFAAADQPCLRAESIQALCRAFERQPQEIFRLSCQGTAGNPVLFPRWAFEELLNLPEGKGGSAVIKSHPERVIPVEIEDPRELVDVDTPDVLRRLLEA